ncbi:YggT family protein [Synechococcus sp. PCC 7336]|uniref:YggT family protein n=1 Tax=Synechococcus sp. PCC 7336 TaxID=195250 RepID=UPI000347D9EF|nr:YggT family protein [Synechococcus sp. PCC 7336]
MDTLTLAIWILNPLLALYILLFILRIPLSWYPQIDTSRFPYILAIAPTEGVLKLTRKVIPTMGGVDMTPVVWVGIVSFVREILLGQQGLLTMAAQVH